MPSGPISRPWRRHQRISVRGLITGVLERKRGRERSGNGDATSFSSQVQRLNPASERFNTPLQSEVRTLALPVRWT
jgi:hypothetical protein